jgi:ATP-dependent Lon protease
MVLPLFVGRERSIDALEHAMLDNKQVLLVAQRNASDDEPSADDLYQVGTVSNILQLLKLPDGTIKVLVEGGHRAAVIAVDEEETFAVATVREIETDTLAERESAALLKATVEQFERYVGLSKKVPAEVLTSLSGIDDPGRLADTISAHMSMALDEKQRILEISDIAERLAHLQSLMDAEIDVFQVEKRIRGRVKKQMEKSQREYYLNEQMKAIQKELGEMDDAPNEIDDLQNKINEARMSEEAFEKANAELSKLKMMSPMSAEASVVRGYLDWMVSVPWSKRSKVRHDLKRAQGVLNSDHFGLEEVKEANLGIFGRAKAGPEIKGPSSVLGRPARRGKNFAGRVDRKGD